MKIAVLGAGYVGLVAAVSFADAGHDVIGVEWIPSKIAALQSGKVPFYEPGLAELLERYSKRLRFTSNIADAVVACPVIFIAVGTPELPDGSADMEPTLKVLKEVCATANEDKILVFKSTVPIGTHRQIKLFCREHTKFHMDIVSNPEFLRQGSALEDFLKPDRIVIGCESARARQVMKELYEPFAARENRPIFFMDNTSAEMTKYVANAFLALKISFINEMALLADKVGADIDSVRAGFTSDSRINPAFFRPGIGYGGSCFPKDVRALIFAGKNKNIDLRVLKAADEVNERQKTILTERLITRLGSLKGITVGIWGLAFKPDTDDVRRAPSLKIIEELFLNGAKVKAYDPVATKNAIEASRVPFDSFEDPTQVLDGIDALLIVTEWPEFQSFDWANVKGKMRQPLIFDGRNLYDPAQMKALGIEYYGIGRQVRTDSQDEHTNRNDFLGALFEIEKKHQGRRAEAPEGLT